jgi:hypothetical protein
MICPICHLAECKGYPLLWERYAAGRDVEHWLRIHDRLNGLPVAQSPPDPWLAVIRACPDHNPGCCAHPAAYCTRFARDVTHEHCIACLTERGIRPEPTEAQS